MTHFAELVQVTDHVSRTRSRTAKVALLAELLRTLEPGEVEPAIGFLTATPRQGRLGVGWRTLGSLDVAPAATPTLTIGAVDTAISDLAAAVGAGSVASRGGALQRLWALATEPEQAMLARILLGELRIGALEGVLTDAAAQAASVPADAVRRAAMLSGSLSRTAALALAEGGPALDRVGLTVGTPVQPMLAATAADVAAALERTGPASVEVKLDGARVQVHRHGGPGSRVQVFTRTLAEITDRVPELVEVVHGLPGTDLILDGETLALDEDGRPRPFQETMSRFGSGAAGAELLRPWFFDVLRADGTDLLDEPLARRAEVLHAVVGRHGIPSVQTADPAVAEAFARQALADGHEGVLVKALDTPYAAGRRGAAWLKVKPVLTYDLVVLAAEWGSGRRAGWLSNLHLGARDPSVPLGQPGAFVMVGKTFKGLTDEVLRWQTERFPQVQTHQTRYAVHVEPVIVVEIAIDGVQRSSRYPGGVALRFARVKRYRPDKTPADADTIDTLRALLR